MVTPSSCISWSSPLWSSRCIFCRTFAACVLCPKSGRHHHDHLSMQIWIIYGSQPADHLGSGPSWSTMPRGPFAEIFGARNQNFWNLAMASHPAHQAPFTSICCNVLISKSSDSQCCIEQIYKLSGVIIMKQWRWRACWKALIRIIPSSTSCQKNMTGEAARQLHGVVFSPMVASYQRAFILSTRHACTCVFGHHSYALLLPASNTCLSFMILGDIWRPSTSLLFQAVIMWELPRLPVVVGVVLVAILYGLEKFDSSVFWKAESSSEPYTLQVHWCYWSTFKKDGRW